MVGVLRFFCVYRLVINSVEINQDWVIVMTVFPSKSLYTGLAVGGPMAGEVLTTDYPKGIVIIDRPRGQMWIYDWDLEKKNFSVRGSEPQVLQWSQEEQYNIRRAMEENNYEVRSHPKAGEDY